MSYQRRTEIAAEEVRALLGRNRQSIAELSRSTGISLPTLHRRLLVQSAFTIDELDKIAEHFGVTALDLLRSPVQAGAAS